MCAKQPQSASPMRCVDRWSRHSLSPRARATTVLSREIQDLVRAQLSQHEYPRQMAFVSELPKTPAGKVHRKVLRERERAAASRLTSNY